MPSAARSWAIISATKVQPFHFWPELRLCHDSTFRMTQGYDDTNHDWFLGGFFGVHLRWHGLITMADNRPPSHWNQTSRPFYFHEDDGHKCYSKSKQVHTLYVNSLFIFMITVLGVHLHVECWRMYIIKGSLEVQTSDYTESCRELLQHRCFHSRDVLAGRNCAKCCVFP